VGGKKPDSWEVELNWIAEKADKRRKNPLKIVKDRVQLSCASSLDSSGGSADPAGKTEVGLRIPVVIVL
jgi:hypothetical protein